MSETKEQLASRLASALWDVSAIRHGMFTPPVFRAMAEHFLLQELNRDMEAEAKALEAVRFHDFEIELTNWQAAGRIGEPPRKPKGYDLWKQGDNPLGLDL